MRAHIRSSNSALTTTGVCTIVRSTCYILQILNFELYEHIQCAKSCIFVNLNWNSSHAKLMIILSCSSSSGSIIRQSMTEHHRACQKTTGGLAQPPLKIFNSL